MHILSTHRHVLFSVSTTCTFVYFLNMSHAFLSWIRSQSGLNVLLKLLPISNIVVSRVGC